MVPIIVLILITPSILCLVNADLISDQSEPLFQRLWDSSAIGTGVAVDSTGNIYVTGITAAFGLGNLSAYRAVFLLKYDPTGNLVWQRVWSGNGNGTDYASAAAVDSSGNIYVTGWTFSFGAGMGDILLLKFNSTGSLIWQRTFGGSGDDQGSGVAVDSSGNIYVTGGIQGGSGSDDVIILKFDPSGEVLWQKSWGGTHFDYGGGVIVDSYGDIYVTGSTESFGSGPESLFLLKLNSSGSLIWQKDWGPNYPKFATGEGIAIDSSGSIYVTGYYSFSIPDPDNVLDILLLKFDSSGNLMWQRTWDSGSWDRAEDVAVDSYGGVYVTGCVLAHAGYDVLLVKFDSSGNQAGIVTWGNNAPGNSQKGYSVAVDSSGDAVVTGFVDFGPPYTMGYTNGTIGAPSFSLGVPSFTLDTPTFTPYTPGGVVQTPFVSEDNTGMANGAFLVKFMPLSYTETYAENIIGLPPMVFYGVIGSAVVLIGALTMILLRRRKGKDVLQRPEVPKVQVKQ